MIVMGDLMTRYYANAYARTLGKPQIKAEADTKAKVVADFAEENERIYLSNVVPAPEPLTDRSGSVGIRPEFDERKLRKEQMNWMLSLLTGKPTFVGDSSEFGGIAIDAKTESFDQKLNAKIQKLADETRKHIEEAACERLPDDVLAAIRLHDAKEAAHSEQCKGRAISKALKHGRLTKEQCHYLLNCIPDEEIREYAEQYL